jgi:hypothetical protein
MPLMAAAGVEGSAGVEGFTAGVEGFTAAGLEGFAAAGLEGFTAGLEGSTAAGLVGFAAAGSTMALGVSAADLGSAGSTRRIGGVPGGVTAIPGGVRLSLLRLRVLRQLSQQQLLRQLSRQQLLRQLSRQWLRLAAQHWADLVLLLRPGGLLPVRDAMQNRLAGGPGSAINRDNATPPH